MHGNLRKEPNAVGYVINNLLLQENRISTGSA
jgi:hypothetical protein